MLDLLNCLPRGKPAEGLLVAPVEPDQEVWAAGVTYLRSREAREAESRSATVYERVYDAPRPELFLKAVGWRVVGHGAPVRIRQDSRWNVPEPELAILVNGQGEIVGLSAGNDMSSRDIEGENPLYLPQAKIYAGSCGLGPGIEIAAADEMQNLPVTLSIQRGEGVVFQGETSTSQMKRGLQELVDYLFSELAFPHGVWLMTGTGIVPPDDFTLEVGDRVQIQVGSLSLENLVAS
jgi:2-dehydro-3-deoxy-D-arabinonate dehydratase